MELLDLVHPGWHVRTGSRRQIRALLMARDSDLGIGRSLLRVDQCNQPDKRQNIRRGRILVCHHQGPGRDRHDCHGQLSSGQR
ncbi:hypothetical protein D3C84_970710 [compost metagenome]